MAFNLMFFALAVTLAVVCLILFFFKEPSRIQQRLQAPLKWEPVLVQSDDSTRVLPAGLVKKVEEKLGLGRNSVKAQEMKRTLDRAGFQRGGRRFDLHGTQGGAGPGSADPVPAPHAAAPP